MVFNNICWKIINTLSTWSHPRSLWQRLMTRMTCSLQNLLLPSSILWRGHWRLRPPRMGRTLWRGHPCTPGDSCRWRYCRSGPRTFIRERITSTKGDSWVFLALPPHRRDWGSRGTGPGPGRTARGVRGAWRAERPAPWLRRQETGTSVDTAITQPLPSPLCLDGVSQARPGPH